MTVTLQDVASKPMLIEVSFGPVLFATSLAGSDDWSLLPWHDRYFEGPYSSRFLWRERHFFAPKKAEYDDPASVAAKLLPRESVSSRAPELSRGLTNTPNIIVSAS